ncbi:MAG TPA: carboxymuconolactone decarboxylase family protein [Acidimicrobiales bacterium]|jgi:alkylhydroperoxidase family enzyme
MTSQDRPRPSSPRLAPLDTSTADEETQQYAPPGSFNIFRTLAHHPKLLKRWLVFGNHVLGKNTLPERERELLILRTGWSCRAVYEFGQHTVIGANAGVADDEIVALTRSLDEHPWGDDDRALLTAADELHADQCITDDTWAHLTRWWNEQQLIDIVFTVGQYTLVSMALNTLGVELDDGLPGFPR